MNIEQKNYYTKYEVYKNNDFALINIHQYLSLIKNNTICF